MKKYYYLISIGIFLGLSAIFPFKAQAETQIFLSPIDPVLSVGGTVNVYAQVYNNSGTVLSYGYNYDSFCFTETTPPTWGPLPAGNGYHMIIDAQLTIKNFDTTAYQCSFQAWGTSSDEMILTRAYSYPNIKPVAKINPKRIEYISGTQNTFDGSSSYDPDGDIVNWLFNCGAASSAGGGPDYIMCRGSGGTYKVSLTVTDNEGFTNNASATAMPSPAVRAECSFSSGSTYDFRGTAEDLPSVSTWFWSFGDGATHTDYGPAYSSPSHTYSGGLAWPYSLMVTYNDGVAFSASGNTNNCPPPGPINQPPSAAFSAIPTSGNVPLLVNFTDASTDSDGTITSWAWDFDNNGSTDSTAQNPMYTYNNQGAYTVKLTVADDDGATDDEIKIGYITVIMPNQPPTTALDIQDAFGTPIISTTVNTFIYLYVGGSSDPDGSISTVKFCSDNTPGNGTCDNSWTGEYTWTTSSGNWDATQKKMTWSFTTSGNKGVYAQVKDNNGAWSTAVVEDTIMVNPACVCTWDPMGCGPAGGCDPDKYYFEILEDCGTPLVCYSYCVPDAVCAPAPLPIIPKSWREILPKF